MSKKIETKVFSGKEEEWNKQAMFVIYPVDEDGEKANGKDTKNVFKCGIKKLEYILKHLPEAKQFVEDNS